MREGREWFIFTPMFKLTRQEMYVVAFVAGAILLGSAARQWRAHRDSQKMVAGQAVSAMTTDLRTP